MTELKVDEVETAALELKVCLESDIRVELWGPRVNYYDDAILVSVDSTTPVEVKSAIKDIVNHNKVNGIDYILYESVGGMQYGKLCC